MAWFCDCRTGMTGGWAVALHFPFRVRPRGPGAVDVYDAATGQPLGTVHAQPARPAPDETHTAPTATKDTDVTDTDNTQAPPRADRDEVVGEPDFCLSLAKGRIVATGALLEAGENVADIVEARAMSCIYPDAGLGKSFSVLAALKEVSAERVLLQFRSRPTLRGIRQELFN
ncbi:hypothetical protein AB0D89_28620 [Streptomyces luteogriseus]|uniref:hypothetical protein n=1 Tax=Streptomyces luteogriseus TaxID=68233 RepID=UPI00068D1A09